MFGLWKQAWRWLYGFGWLFWLLLAGCEGEAPKLVNGQALPETSLARLDGSRLRCPQDVRGQVVAIRFWADWCPFCKEEMTALEPLYRRYRERGFEVLAVNVRQDPERVRAFSRSLGFTYEALLDRDGAVARTYGVQGLPTTIFIDRGGLLRGRIVGESSPELTAKLVEELLAAASP